MKEECTVRIQQTGEELLKVYDNRKRNDVASHRLIVGDALYGGRTEPFVYYYPKTNRESEIYYSDFTSLYFRVQKTQKFPGSIPNKLVGEQIPSNNEYIEDINIKIFGVSYVRLLPTQGLYISLLQGSYEGRIVFTLCRTCAKEGQD